MNSKILAIIPAAGIGQRFGTDKPKQYEYIDGMTVIESAVKPFLDSNLIHSIVIPVSSSDLFIKEQSFFDHPKVTIVEGGFTRAESVYKSLCHVEIDSFDFVITHDAARPNVTEEDIVNIYEEIIKKDSDCSIFYIPVVDSIKKIQEKKTLDKANYYLVQTPQISKIKKLEQALKILISKDIMYVFA